MQDLDALRAYLSKPSAYWPEGAGQPVRLESRLAELEETLRTDRTGVIDELVAVGRFRARFAARSIYIDSLGHSGSRWLMGVLGGLVDTVPAGEVYLPQDVFEELIRPSKRERRAIVQGIYAAHAYRPDLALITGHSVNTCHTTSVHRYSRHDGDALKILLKRDPADLVLARALTGEGGAGPDAAAAVEAAIRKVSDFFEFLKPEEFDLVVRYEDLMAEPEPIVREIAGRLEASPDPARIAAALSAEGRDAEDYRARIDVPAALEARAREAMVPVATKLGY